MTLLLLIALACQLPTYGEISDLKGLSKVYVVSTNEDSRKRISKALSKSLEVVNDPDSAQFFMEYTELSREAVSTTDQVNQRQQRSQMSAYVMVDKKRVIVWSDDRSRETEHFMGMKMYDSGRNETELAKAFLKALKKVNKG
jgi:hypothetical protein